jgi:outer membrane protein TolC
MAGATRALSLQDCIVLALEKNLALRIERLRPEITRYNLNVANASYDPEFYASARRSHTTDPNVMTPTRRRELERRAASGEASVAEETLAQAEAQQDFNRANEDIRAYSSRMAEINDDERLGRITPPEAQLRRLDEQTRLGRAQSDLAAASSILNAGPQRMAEAQNQVTRAQDLRRFLDRTKDGDSMPDNGVIDPTGARLFRTDETDRDTLGAGLRGILPSGATYDVFLNTTHDTFHGNASGDAYSSVAGLTLSQPLLRNLAIDSTRVAIKVSKNELKSSEWGLILAVMTTVSEVEKAYFDLIASVDYIRVQQKALELAKRSYDEIRRKVEVGVLAALEEQQAAAQASTAKANLLTAEQLNRRQENLLKNLITDDYAQWHGLVLQPSEKLLAMPQTYELGESWGKALTLRPDYQQMVIDLETRNIYVKFQRNQLLPALDLQGSFALNGLSPRSYGSSLSHIGDGSYPSYGAGLTFTFPLGNREARNRYNIAKAEKEAALLAMKKLEQDILVQVDDAVKQAQNEFERVHATRDARKFAEAALEAEQKKLDNGKSTPFVVLDLQTQLTQASSDELRALAGYNRALTDLSFREGTTLQRHNIRVEIR